MRKIALPVASIAAVALGGVGIAQAIEVDQGLVVKTVGGAKGTKAKPLAVTLSVTTSTSAKGADAGKDGTYSTKSAVIHFDKGLKFNASKFPTCDLQTVATSPSDCPAGSKVGTGSAIATVGAQHIMAHPTIAAYNSKGGKLNLKLIAKAGEVDSSGVLVGTLKKDTGKFANKLVVPIPAALQEQLGLKITLNEFATKIKATYKGVPYVQSVGCTKGKRSYKGDFVFSDGTKESPVTTAKC
jgi:hypothetical protein